MTTNPESGEEQYKTFEELRAGVGELWNKGRPDRAIQILELAREQFPDNLYDIIFSLVYGYLLMGLCDRALDVLEEGVGKGFWFKFPLEAPLIKPLAGHPRFQKILQESDQLWREAQEQCGPDCKVVLPEGFVEGHRYPLFVALHGWGDDVQEMMALWKSSLLGTEWLVAFIESSQLVRMDGGRGWDDVALGRKEIGRFFQETVDKYSVDPDRILAGGFSQGGRMAIDVAIHQVVPVRGFVALCPGGGLPEGFSLERAKVLADRGARGAILTGEHDPDLGEQKEMLSVFEDAGLPCRLTIAPEMGHWFPENFGQQLDQAIEFVLSK